MISIDFSSTTDLDPRLSWLNAPAAATSTPQGLRVVPHLGDWWYRTADSSTEDPERRRVDEAAPLLLVSPAAAAASGGGSNGDGNGDFDAEASVACFHRRDYDQAGICVRVSGSCWLKANVERMPDGRLVLACCVTNYGFTDLSSCPLDERCGGGGPAEAGGIPGASAAIRLRVRRRRGDYSVEWAPPPPPKTTGEEEEEEGEPSPPRFTRFRLCRLHEDAGGGDDVSSLRVGLYASAPVAAGFVALFRSLRVGPPESGPLL